MNIASTLFRIITLGIFLILGSYAAWLSFNQSTDPLTALFYLVPGPSFVSLGIINSFLSKKRPALIRIETVIGVLLAAIGGIVGAFSVGGLLISALFLTTPPLIADALIQGYFDKMKIKVDTYKNNWYIILFILTTIFIIFFLLLRLAIGFALLSVPFLLLWAILLFVSIVSYLPKPKG